MLQSYENKLKKVKDQIREIGNGLLKANELILEALKSCDIKIFDEAKTYIKNVSKKTNDIDNEIMKILALHAPEARDLRQIISYLKITNELLRATINTRSFIRDFKGTCDEMDSEILKEYAKPLQISTTKALDITMKMIDIDCVDELQDSLNQIIIEENKTDDLYEILEKSILDGVHNSDDFKKIHKLLKAFRRSEKIADRAIGIANLLLFIKVGGAFQKVS